jgi:hypothetical protein
LQKIRTLKDKIIARRIAETPILYGEDAVRFLNEMRNVIPVSYDEKKRVR